MFTPKQILRIVLIAVTVILLAQNSYGVSVRFTVISLNLPLSVLLLIVLGIGIAFGFWLDRPKASTGSKEV